MGYLTYRGPADAVLTVGDGEVLLQGVVVLFQQTHTAIFELMFPECPERANCSHVRLTLPDGHQEFGRVTYSTPGALVFKTEDDWGKLGCQP